MPQIPAAYIARAHTVLGSVSFLTALFLGLLFHYKKLCKNAVATYPEEFFPSVSATIGDWYPERNIFQLLIAFTSGPRLGLVAFEYLLHSTNSSSPFPLVTLTSGLLRTITCGGWVYITSSDDGEVHDFFMISYLVLTIPWMWGCTTFNFFLSLIPLVYFYLQHKLHRVPGAYTRYSFFEWGLIALDLMFDSFTEEELRLRKFQFSFGDPSATIQSTEAAKQQTAPTEKAEPEIQIDPSKNPVAKAKAPANPPISAVPESRFSLRLVLPPSLKPFISFVSSIYLSYIFWSIFTSLIPTLFYFSIWELGIAGHELALLSTLSPIFLSFNPVLSWAKSRGGSTTLHIFSLLALGAFILDKPIHRLWLVFLGTCAVMCKQVATWATSDIDQQSIITALGFLLSSLSKHANHTNNPVWPLVNSESGGYNKIGIVLAALAIYEHHIRQPTISETAKDVTQNTNPPQAQVDTTQGHWLAGAVPLGSLIFILHNLLSDSSTLIAWNWTGYQDYQPRGPVPHLHGSLTFAAQLFGLLLALTSVTHDLTDILAHPLWFTYGSAATIVLYAYRDWSGYFGGLNLAVFITSIIPIVLKQASAASGSTWQSTGKVYFTAMLVYCLLALSSTWTVAYAFVVLVAQMACLSLAFRWPGLKLSCSAESKNTLSSNFVSYSRGAIACFAFFSFAASVYRISSRFPQCFKPGPRILTAGIWTIHFGLDNQGRDSQRLVRNVVRDMELDRVVFGERDLTRVIVEEMGYYVDIGPGPASHTWGCVLLSKFPIINSTHHLLPSPGGELAPAIEAVLDVWGTPVTVVVAHNGQEEDPLDRELQSTELARIMAASYPQPVLFLGYVVSKPHAPRPAPYEILVQDGRVFDIDKDDLDRWCEYILYRGMYRTSYARISRGKVTDTELQIGQFVLPPYGTTVVDDSEGARYLRSQKEDMPEHHWFTMDYYEDHPNNKAKGGHAYHVFGTPLYYQIPPDPSKVLCYQRATPEEQR
ncbi:protein cwh43 [Favolaschia claudopus]|uniref:Protein cwh43 n=1 Tax=Favolaschia claudopus TaxID=2862362 RepID=A0AAW0C2A2_9AGAR